MQRTHEIAPGVSINQLVDTGGIGAIDFIVGLRNLKGASDDSRQAATTALFGYIKASPCLQNLGRALGQPLLTTADQVVCIISKKSYAGIRHAVHERHLSAILALLPLAASPDLEQPLPDWLSSLSHVIRVPGQPDTYQGTAASYPALQDFRRSLQLQTGTQFNCDHREVQGSSLVLKHSCFFGGRPSFVGRKSRIGQGVFKRPKSAGHSAKCGCPAYITASIGMDYAHALKLTAVQQEGQPAAVSTSIRVTINLSHEGHTPNSVADLVTLPTDPRSVNLYVFEI